MENRVRELRKYLKMSQAAFGEKLGISRDAVNNLERDRAPLTELKARAICTVFNVNYDWLTGGEGNMFQERSREEELFQWLHGICDDGSDFEKRFISALARLDATEWTVLERMLDKIYDEDVLSKAQPSKAPAAPPKEMPLEEDAPPASVELSEEEMRQIDEETELFRQQKILERTRMYTASSSTAWAGAKSAN